MAPAPDEPKSRLGVAGAEILAGGGGTFTSIDGAGSGSGAGISSDNCGSAGVGTGSGANDNSGTDGAGVWTSAAGTLFVPSAAGAGAGVSVFVSSAGFAASAGTAGSVFGVSAGFTASTGAGSAKKESSNKSSAFAAGADMEITIAASQKCFLRNWFIDLSFISPDVAVRFIIQVQNFQSRKFIKHCQPFFHRQIGRKHEF